MTLDCSQEYWYSKNLEKSLWKLLKPALNALAWAKERDLFLRVKQINDLWFLMKQVSCLIKLIRSKRQQNFPNRQ